MCPDQIPITTEEEEEDIDEIINWIGLPVKFLVSFSDRFVLKCEGEIMNPSYWGKGFYVRGWRIMMASLPGRTVRRKPARELQQSLKEGLSSAVGMVVDITGGRLPKCPA